MAELFVGDIEVLDGVPGFELEFFDRDFGLSVLFLAGVFPDLLLVVLDGIAEILDDFLFEVEAVVESREGGEILGEVGFELLLSADGFCGEFLEGGAGFLVEVADPDRRVLAELSCSAHAALDFLVENHSVEAFLAPHEFVGEGEVAIGGETKEVEEFLDFDFGVFNAF